MEEENIEFSKKPISKTEVLWVVAALAIALLIAIIQAGQFRAELAQAYIDLARCQAPVIAGGFL